MKNLTQVITCHCIFFLSHIPSDLSRVVFLSLGNYACSSHQHVGSTTRGGAFTEFIPFYSCQIRVGLSCWWCLCIRPAEYLQNIPTHLPLMKCWVGEEPTPHPWGPGQMKAKPLGNLGGEVRDLGGWTMKPLIAHQVQPTCRGPRNLRSVLQWWAENLTPNFNKDFLFYFIILFYTLFFAILGPNPWHMEIPRLGVKLEL